MTTNQPDPDEEEQEVAEEIAAATDETPTNVSAPELSVETEELTQWNEVPGAVGSVVPNVTPDDADEGEDSIASQLVYEGIDEAERERRLAAADPDYEP